jgi:YVTN family beta-propeller protein
VRRVVALLILCCIVSLSSAQYVETTILLPDSVSGLQSVSSILFHSPTNTIYLGGSNDVIIAVDARTNSRLRGMHVGIGPHLLCSDPLGNKVYCANADATVTVIDAATNQPMKTIPVQHWLTDIVYNAAEDKVYCGNSIDSFVRVIDCVADSMVARIPVSFGTGALCYNPRLNRIYCAHKDRDEVTVIDCAADTVVRSLWVRGVEPFDICYDSATDCVYTANRASGSVSVIDCEGDTLLRLLGVGREPYAVITGPPGKVYCANHGDSSVSVITDSGVGTVRAVRAPYALSYDPVNEKVHCTSSWNASVAVVDAASDTVVARVEVSGPRAVCWNPAGNSTYVASPSQDCVSVIGGVSDTVEAEITFFVCSPGPLCYSTTSNRLYCLDPGNHALYVIDGDSNRVLKELDTRGTHYGSDTLIWNPVSNKVHINNTGGGTVLILDCASDSITATVETGYWPRALCCSDDGKVYVGHDSGGVAVIDGSGDTVRAVVPVGDNAWSLCYDRADNKVYVGKRYGDPMSVIDADGDSVVASIPVPASYGATVCWNRNHDKVYVCGTYPDTLAVIDCTGDTVLKNIHVTNGLDWMYSDSVCDKVYGVDLWDARLRIIQASTDTWYRNLSVGYVTALLDNGKQGPANRLYCTDRDSGRVTVVRGYKTDSILCRISVGNEPSALAWNPTYSRMYVSNSGSSSISVIRDTFGVGVGEGQLQASSHKLQATIVRGVLVLKVDSRQNTGYRTELLDASGRKVLDLHTGPNDVRALAPGVYFVRAVGREPSAVGCHKVVVTR